MTIDILVEKYNFSRKEILNLIRVFAVKGEALPDFLKSLKKVVIATSLTEATPSQEGYSIASLGGVLYIRYGEARILPESAIKYMKGLYIRTSGIQKSKLNRNSGGEDFSTLKKQPRFTVSVVIDPVKLEQEAEVKAKAESETGKKVVSTSNGSK